MTESTGAARVQARIWMGLARAAARVGSGFDHYRPTGTGPVMTRWPT